MSRHCPEFEIGCGIIVDGMVDVELHFRSRRCGSKVNDLAHVAVLHVR